MAHIDFRLIPFLTVAFIAGTAEAQNDRVPASSWSALSSMGVVNGIVRTQDIVWAATDGGVLRYDVTARSYSRFTRVDGLAGNKVLSAVADADGNLWFGTSGDGLSKFIISSDRFASFTQFRELELNHLAMDGNHLYIASDVGISLFLTEVERVKENYRQFGSLPRDAAVAAVAVHAGKVWAGTEGGLAWADLAAQNLQDPQSWSTDERAGDVADLLVASDTLYAAAGQNVWAWNAVREKWEAETSVGAVTTLGMHDGKVVALTADNQLLQRQSRGNWTALQASGNLRTLSRDGAALWIGTHQGLSVIGEIRPPALGDPPANHFYEMTMSADGDLWVASVPNDRTVQAKGLYHFDRTRWRVHDPTTGTPSPLTVAVEMDRADQLWVGTWGHGLAVFDSQRRWQHLNQSNSVLKGITEPDAPTFVVVSDIERDSHGNMWLANIQGGLAVMDGYPPQRSHLNAQETLGIAPGRNIGKLAIGPDDLKWIGTAQDGLIMFDDGGTPFESGDERAVLINTGFDARLGSNRVTAVYSNEAGVIWIGTDNGLNRIRYRYDSLSGDLEISSWQEYRLQHGLPSPEITDIEGDTEGNIWAASRGGLIQLMASGALLFTYTTANSPLIDDRVESLLFDETEGELWVGTFDGLALVQISGTTESDESNTTAYPNPWSLSPVNGDRLTFRVAEGSSVRIFSVDGGLVRQLEASQENSLTWDGTNEDGQIVSSGIFFFVATDRQGRSTSGKFAVIREE